MKPQLDSRFTKPLTLGLAAYDYAKGSFITSGVSRKDDVSMATTVWGVEGGPSFSCCKFWGFAEIRFSLAMARNLYLSPQCAFLSFSRSSSPLFLASGCLAPGCRIQCPGYHQPAGLCSWGRSMCLPSVCLIPTFIPEMFYSENLHEPTPKQASPSSKIMQVSIYFLSHLISASRLKYYSLVICSGYIKVFLSLNGSGTFH